MGREVDQSVTWTNDYTNPDVDPYWLQNKYQRDPLFFERVEKEGEDE